MKKLIPTGLMLALTIATSASALAGRTSYHQLLENQEWRIEQGVESGALNHKEAKLLRREHRKLKKLAEKLSRDGRLSRRDRHLLDERFDAASAQIYRLKHNDRYAYGAQRGYDRDGRVCIRLSDNRW